MKPLFFSLCLVALGGLFTSSTASAQGFGDQGNLGFLPFGFYQPYGAQYGTSLRTPPYFALNPPVYYGTRYSRPYGLSPFAAPPVVNTPDSYTGRQATQFVRPPMGNPYISQGCSDCVGKASQADDFVVGSQTKGKQIGLVQNNPYVVDTARVANR